MDNRGGDPSIYRNNYSGQENNYNQHRVSRNVDSNGQFIMKMYGTANPNPNVGLFVCALCRRDDHALITLPCGESFCEQCLVYYYQRNQNRALCPLCRRPYQISLIQHTVNTCENQIILQKAGQFQPEETLGEKVTNIVVGTATIVGAIGKGVRIIQDLFGKKEDKKEKGDETKHATTDTR